jgi:hypothetical protein
MISYAWFVMRSAWCVIRWLLDQWQLKCGSSLGVIYITSEGALA